MGSEQSKLKENRVLVFDFDRTLTVKHTTGCPISVPIGKKDVWPGDTYEQLIEKLANFKTRGFKLYICSRGVQSEISDWLQENAEELMALIPIENIMGAKTAWDISPLSTRAENKAHWAKLKPKMIQAQLGLSEEEKQNVHFFDDTLDNVTAAGKAGFNAYNVVKPDALMAKLDDLFPSPA